MNEHIKLDLPSIKYFTQTKAFHSQAASTPVVVQDFTVNSKLFLVQITNSIEIVSSPHVVQSWLYCISPMNCHFHIFLINVKNEQEGKFLMLPSILAKNSLFSQ